MGERSHQSLDRIFFALSHATRRRILAQLGTGGEARVTDLARRHRISLNTVSKHIRILEESRLVRRRVRGRDHLIRLELERLDEARGWLDHHREFWAAQLEGLEDFFERKQNPESAE
jgi:DNA-binding transcriptional ArsR family regulator